MAILATEGIECERSWASLPVILLWMIKDKLDIFDNWRFEAVCRDWRSASQSYPKILQSVGDGLPWIWKLITKTESHLPRLPRTWQLHADHESSLWELICVKRECKLILDMPELANSKVLFSKEGWLLLQTGEYFFEECLILVNPFTRAKIEFPGLSCQDRYLGYFTTQDGYPHRVSLFSNGYRKVVMKETCTDDQVWTDHVFSVEGPKLLGEFYSFIVIGDNAYCQECNIGKMAFNLVNHTWKCLPETEAWHGYFVDRDGELVFIELGGPELSSYAIYRYSEDGSSWVVLNNDQVMDTSWFLSNDSQCIVAKGKGVKVYCIKETETYENLGRRGRIKRKSVVTHVDVHNLVTGSSETLRLPFELHHSPHWVAIG